MVSGVQLLRPVSVVDPTTRMLTWADRNCGRIPQYNRTHPKMRIRHFFIGVFRVCWVLFLCERRKCYVVPFVEVLPLGFGKRHWSVLGWVEMAGCDGRRISIQRGLRFVGLVRECLGMKFVSHHFSKNFFQPPLNPIPSRQDSRETGKNSPPSGDPD